MKKRVIFWLTMAMGILVFSSVFAAEDEKLFPGCTEEKIVVGTGLPTAPYSQMMKTAIKFAPELICEYVGSTGGEDNIQAMLDRKIDAGMVQADVLDFLSRTDPMIKKKIRSLVALHTNYMHIFTLRNGFKVSQGRFKSDKVIYIQDLQQLKGGVRVAAFGSGPISTTQVSERLGLNLSIIKVATKEEGLAMLKEGKVYAFIAMGGKPIPWVQSLDKNTYSMVNVNADDIRKLGAPYFAGKLTYKNLDITGINTISVRNDLVVWNTEGNGAKKLVALRDFFYKNLDDIKDIRGAHPAWQEIDRDTLNDLSWPRYEPPGFTKVPVKAAKKRK